MLHSGQHLVGVAIVFTIDAHTIGRDRVGVGCRRLLGSGHSGFGHLSGRSGARTLHQQGHTYQAHQSHRRRIGPQAANRSRGKSASLALTLPHQLLAVLKVYLLYQLIQVSHGVIIFLSFAFIRAIRVCTLVSLMPSISPISPCFQPSR